jgi:hypothetical protein
VLVEAAKAAATGQQQQQWCKLRCAVMWLLCLETGNLVTSYLGGGGTELQLCA